MTTTTVTTVPTRGGLTLPVGWPVTAVLLGFPVWWVLGLSTLIFPILAVPMARHLWRTRERLRVPPGFGLWLMFLVIMFASAFALEESVPGTLGGSTSSRLINYTYKAVLYLSATVLLLYVANLRESELSARRITRMLGFFFVFTAFGGMLGVLFPQGNFSTPTEALLPSSLSGNGFVQDLVHPSFAQVQDFLGYDTPRPSAPFQYTNEWGGNFTYLVPFFVVGYIVMARRGRRTLPLLLLAVAMVPAVLSLNRAMWLALVLSVGYVIVRLARRSPKATAGLAAAAALAGVVIAASLGSLITARLETGHSDSRRGWLVEQAVSGSLKSPIIGWGTSRPAVGNGNSIASGETPECPNCKAPPIGSHGQLWLVMFSHGIVGAFFFMAFFVRQWWAFRRLASPLGIAVALVVLLWLLESTVYNGLPFALHLVMFAVALGCRMLWGQAGSVEAASGEAVPVTADAQPLDTTPRPQAPVAGGVR